MPLPLSCVIRRLSKTIDSAAKKGEVSVMVHQRYQGQESPTFAAGARATTKLRLTKQVNLLW